MAEPFRPYPEPGTDNKGTFRPLALLRDTILLGPFQFGGLVPHFVLPFYMAYLLLQRSGYWTSETQYIINGLVVPALQGLSVGGILTMGFLRFGTQRGKMIAKKRKEKAATVEEDRSQYNVELALWVYMYLGFGTLLWHYFPSTEGPGGHAVKRLAEKFRVGLAFGDSWI